MFVPVRALDAGAGEIVEKRLPVSLRNALQQYAEELASKVRGCAAKKCAKEQLEGTRRKRRTSRAPGLMDVLLAGRCLSK